MSQPNGLPLHVGPVLAPSKEGIHSEAPPTRPPQKRVFKLAVVILAIVALEYLRINVSHISHLPFAWITSTTSFQAISDNIIWKSCGENYGDNVQCANVTVPLDYHNPGDGRTYSVAMARLLASDKANRKGSVFVNPGGPGGSGTSMAKRGQALARVLKNQYDIIGIDPRGVGDSTPYVSCFESLLDEEAYEIASHGLGFNLPANLTAFSYLRNDVLQQTSVNSANMESLARKCIGRSGEVLPYVGTEFVIRDIDYVARLIDDSPINFWGFSYGTVIGQYMVKVLAPERLGRIVIDGVVNAAIWNRHSDRIWDQGLQDTDNVLFSFASSCLAAGGNCTLNNDAKITSTSALLSKIDQTIDSLYAKPVPILDLGIPAIATAWNLRRVLFQGMYSIAAWPTLAQRLSEGFSGNFTGIVDATLSRIHAESATKPDQSSHSVYAIICADALSYPTSSLHPPPSEEDMVDHLFYNLKRYSHRFGEAHWILSLCHLWAKVGLPPSRSQYSGTFELEDDTLTTPMLILSNTYDPVTPLEHAMAANQRLGNNARLIQQIGGFGHCAVGHFSYCTALATREYFLDGTVPDQKHTACQVDQVPFQPWVPTYAFGGQDEEDLRQAWTEVGDQQITFFS